MIRKCLLLVGIAGLAATGLQGRSRTDGAAPVLRATVISTIAEAEHAAGAFSRGGFGLLLLSDALVAEPGETASGPGPVSERLAGLARRTALAVAAPVVERPGAPPGRPRLALTLTAPGRSVSTPSYAVTPVVPMAGLAFAAANSHDPADPVDMGGFSVGIAAIGDAEAAIARFGDRGAALVLLTGGPVGRTQIERFAEVARVNRVALLVAGRCAGTSSCIGAAAVDADGRIDWTGARNHAFARPARSSPASATGLPEIVPQPARYAHSPALAQLGRVLFFDRDISDAGTIACASCHDPTLAFSDGRRLGTGAFGRETKRNVPSLLNVAFRPVLRWDGYASSLENFVKYPVSGHDDMDSHDLGAVLDRIGGSPDYRARFAAAFGRDGIDFEMVERSLAAYMRTLVSGDSPFDRAMVDGQRTAMTPAAWRGYALFTGRAGCAACHTYSRNGPFFSDSRIHNTGLGWDSDASRYRDAGAGAIGAKAFSGGFRTPTLRDVARTGPYMHDGSIATLRGVIDYFDRGGGDGPGRDPGLRPLHLSERDKMDLEAFLIALTGRTGFDRDGRRTDRQFAGPRGTAAHAAQSFIRPPECCASRR